MRDDIPLDNVPDIKVGDWVTITYSKPKTVSTFGDGYVLEKENHCQSYGGSPVKIMGINMPFIAVVDGDSGGSIDLRRHRIVKCNQQYVDAMLEIRQYSINDDKGAFLKLSGFPERSDRKKRKRLKRKANKDPSLCLKCGHKRRQLSHGNGWYWFCDQCEGGTNSIGAKL